jgi:hypothetical protein
VAGNASALDWCVTSAECNAAKGTCVVWPRCRNYPYLGCLAGVQLCESVRLEGDPPPYSGTNLTAATGIPWAPASPSFLIPLVFLLLFTVIVVAAFAAGLIRGDCCAGVPTRRPNARRQQRMLQVATLDEHYTRATNVF